MNYYPNYPEWKPTLEVIKVRIEVAETSQPANKVGIAFSPAPPVNKIYQGPFRVIYRRPVIPSNFFTCPSESGTTSRMKYKSRQYDYENIFCNDL